MERLTLKQFVKNPVLFSIFVVCFIAVPFLSYTLYTNEHKGRLDCEGEGKRKDSLFIEYVKAASFNQCIIEATNIVTDTTKK